jgi:hypothetical protein
MTDDATQRARDTLARLRCWRQLYSTAMPIDDPDVSTIDGAIRQAEARGHARAIEAAARVAEHHPYREGLAPAARMRKAAARKSPATSAPSPQSSRPRENAMADPAIVVLATLAG